MLNRFADGIEMEQLTSQQSRTNGTNVSFIADIYVRFLISLIVLPNVAILDCLAQVVEYIRHNTYQSLPLFRPATIHFSTIRYVSQYSCHDTIHNTIRYITTKRLVSCSWASEVCTADKPSWKHACVCCVHHLE